ncbi:MAG: DUF6206 family protein [Actinomycetota bacterium]
MERSGVSEAELAELEAVVVDALAARNDATLTVLGYGEVSVALGWPIDTPRFVCKRTPPFTAEEFRSYRDLVAEYIDRLQAAGLSVAETALVPLDRGDQVIAYLIQPMFDSATLGHRVLAAAEPNPEHPFLVAVTEALELVSPTLSIDAQVTNFAWDGSTLTLVDVGTPFLWDDTGTLRFNMRPFSKMLPAPTRPLAIRELTKLVTRWNDPRRVGTDIVANLYREGLTQWVDPAVEALNRRFGSTDPITAEEGRAFYEEDTKIWPLLKRLQTAERWWQTSVRRRPYDWFIHSTFNE